MTVDKATGHELNNMFFYLIIQQEQRITRGVVNMSEPRDTYASSFSHQQSDMRRWVRLYRWLWRVLSFIWGTIIVGIVIGAVANFSTTTTLLSNLFIVHIALTYPIPVFSSLSFLALLTLLSWIGSREKQAIPASSLSEQNRAHMLRLLHLIYEDLLAQSLQGALLVELQLASKPDAVQNASQLLLRSKDLPERLLPTGTSLVDVYEQANHELLILGEPGTGKSTLLLQLAQQLLALAEQDERQKLPILLPLSSWAVKRSPLQDWLAEEVAQVYSIPEVLARRWVEEEQFLPLLDGLDEVETSIRPACIAAINIYRKAHPIPLVICSRTFEYSYAAPYEKLALQNAVVVQPLTRTQVDTYLSQMGKPLAALRSALIENPALEELASTPLMLQILMLTYQGTSTRDLSSKETLLEQQVWTDYVQRMVERKGDTRHYPLHRTITWLSWLARKMQEHNLAIFYLGSLQPDWLPMHYQAIYRWSVGSFTGLLVGLLAGLAFGLVFGPLSALVAGLLFGLLVSLAFGLLFRRRIAAVEPIQRFILRWLLWRLGYFPWNYQGFLEDAMRRVLLRRVGGGYTFVHRLLQDYFSSLATSLSDISPVESTQAYIQMIEGSTMITGKKEQIVLRVVNDTLRPMEKIEIELLPSAEYTLLTQKATIPSLAPKTASNINFHIQMNVTKQVTVNYRLNGEIRIPPLYVDAIKDNPYSYGNPVDETGFFGREEEVKNILQAVTKPIKQDIFVMGERRSGKTSLLYLLNKRLSAPFIPVYIILTECEPRTDALLDHIVGKIIRSLNEHDVLEVSWTTNHFTSSDFDGTILEIIQAAQRRIPNIHLVLLFDEADFLLQVEEERPSTSPSKLFGGSTNKVDERIQRILRAALQSPKFGSRLRAVVAGTAILSTYMLQHSSPFFNHFRFVNLKPLSQEETHDLIVKPAHLLGYTYSPNAIERITYLSGGQPYYCQALCYEAFTFVLQQENTVIDDTAVDVAEEKIRNDLFVAYLSGYWQRASAQERAVLTTLAKGNESTAFSHADTERLLDWQLILQAGEGYRFSAGLFQQWTMMALEKE